jgi:hypothetical protein
MELDLNGRRLSDVTGENAGMVKLNAVCSEGTGD